MSRILRRPMFRGGRVESKEDLKVVDQMGIAKLATGGRVGYDGGGEVKDYMEIIEAVRKSRPDLPEKKGMSTADYLRIASAGMDILGAPSEGSGIGGALRSAAAPLSKLGGDMAGSLDARTAARAELLANEESAITDMAGAIMKSRNYRPDRGFALSQKLEDLKKYGEKKQTLVATLDDATLLATYVTENNIEGETNEEKIANAKTKINNELDLVNSALRVLEPKDEYLLAFLKSGRAGQFFESIIQAEVQAQKETAPKGQDDPNFNWNKVIERASSGRKDGGLMTGYAQGGLTEMMAEETITPKGVEMQEEVVEETPEQSSSAPLTYDELRLRLPPEVSDDVVKLLASSDGALLEFSNIATQQDVDEFNVKYGVELVLPQV
jgi:hypothetical protein